MSLAAVVEEWRTAPVECQCVGIRRSGPDERECFTCGRTIFVDASKYPIFNLTTGQIEHTAISTVEPDWTPLDTTAFRRRLHNLQRELLSERLEEAEQLCFDLAA
ncbi:MAG TPA: hypothetical protein VN612_04620 [Acidobacteriaceae bacterium]|nr:hypothetical protein [Acidobacteriaceae bacterium]